MSELKKNERAIVVSALKRAAPYIRMFKGKIFVLKIGGEALLSSKATNLLVEQIGILYDLGIKVILVHGGGPQSTELAKSLGIDSKFIEGRRVTDKKALEISAMVLNGQINTKLLACFRDLAIPAVGISGVDAGLIQAIKRPVVQDDKGVKIKDYGFVGDIQSVEANILFKQLDNGLIPVVSPLSADDKGTLLNINADTVAAAIASAMKAEKLILAMSAPGILEDKNNPKSMISYVDINGLKKLKDEGKLEDGMLPKAKAIELALTSGVPRVHVISYDLADSLLLEIFTNDGTGTLVVNDINILSKAEKK
ncbi:MAG: acetylglutamate kinase [Gammaproteobacteria bacterium TMED78]|nr:MAG: acetylglutamate kinase [Gammaproteobacteria bacterium TMED78]|tara:strand:- start:32 stop:961 length:930 start_codon:yes stop_codon:yes gene_type:complete